MTPALESNFVALVMSIETSRPVLEDVLWLAQEQCFPGSRRMTLPEVYKEWLDGTNTDAIERHMVDWDLRVSKLYKGETLHVARLAAFQDFRLTQRVLVAHSLCMCLQYPAGVFYEWKSYRGYRFGLEGSDYLSGFGRY